ncbi:hypothetical protein TMatcc_005943 [Talaromyces marneffei ATCC 18224]|uniref:uncharacterized protein n=1 Tax=Talaromyces marneffei TaxID=37727 RepID=UPI0012A92AD7|nr:uncharacterized protein EYB26_005561 [Talaromyces marneffei]QGA17885.1 hypothetical protein EYB26_005561 [Talaromyces marneffei]
MEVLTEWTTQWRQMICFGILAKRYSGWLISPYPLVRIDSVRMASYAHLRFGYRVDLSDRVYQDRASRRPLARSSLSPNTTTQHEFTTE